MRIIISATDLVVQVRWKGMEMGGGDGSGGAIVTTTSNMFYHK